MCLVPRMVVVVVSLACAAATSAESIGWRSDGSGRYPQANPPLRWSKNENVVWKTELPGRSYGSPIVVGKRIFVTSDPAELLCLSADSGEILWQRSNSVIDVFGEEEGQKILDELAEHEAIEKELKKKLNELKKNEPGATDRIEAISVKLKAARDAYKQAQQRYPRVGKMGATSTAATPVSDGENVYAAFGSGIVAAYSVGGQRRWIKYVESSTLGFGHSSSPVLVGNRLVVHFKDLVALDAKDGVELWREELHARHASAIAAKIGDEDVLVSPAPAIVRVRDGKVLATDGLVSTSEASPILHEGVIYAQGNRPRALKLPEDSGDELAVEVLWESSSSRGRRTPSPVLHDGLLYGVNTDGTLDVTDVESGRVIYRKRLEIGKVYSSPALAGGRLYVTSTGGTTVVLAPGSEYQELARNEFDATGACPAFEKNRMYVRTRGHLACIAE